MFMKCSYSGLVHCRADCLTQKNRQTRLQTGSQCSPGVDEVLHQGWLRKRPRSSIVGTSKDRFFVLTKDALRYYQVCVRVV